MPLVLKTTWITGEYLQYHLDEALYVYHLNRVLYNTLYNTWTEFDLSCVKSIKEFNRVDYLNQEFNGAQQHCATTNGPTPRDD